MTTQAAQLRIKDLEQQLQEKDIALSGLQAKLAGLLQQASVHQREKSQLWDQAQTLQVLAVTLGLKPGTEAIGSVTAAVVDLIAERDRYLAVNRILEKDHQELAARQENIIQHAAHAARSMLCTEIETLFDRHSRLTAEQVLDLIAPDEKPDAA